MINDEQARALWQRAAELQAAAEQQRDRQLPAVRSDEDKTSGLTLAQVAQAAEGAGIDPDFVRVAVAEQQLVDAKEIDPRQWSARWLRRLIKEPDAIALERTVAAPPATVLQALRTVSVRPPYELIHEATVGTDPLQDAVLVYRTPGNNSSFGQSMNFSDVRVFLFSVRGAEQGTRLSVRVPLYRRGINLGVTGLFSGLLGTGGAALGNAIAGPLSALVAGSAAVAAAPIVIGAGGGALLGVRVFKKLYRVFHDGGKAGVMQLLQAIEQEAESAGARDLPPGEPQTNQ